MVIQTITTLVDGGLFSDKTKQQQYVENYTLYTTRNTQQGIHMY